GPIGRRTQIPILKKKSSPPGTSMGSESALGYSLVIASS
ncbi:hypothetical protein CEXT_275011, partial [Caerostris extrusa]